MKKLSIILLLCVFTIPANASFLNTLDGIPANTTDFKGKVGSSEFCSSTKQSANSTLQDYQEHLKAMRVSRKYGIKDQELKNLKAVKNYIKDLHMVSNIYSAWCK
jgi:hypothetical protein